MLDLDRTMLHSLVEEYRANFSKNISREIYKWRIVECFQRHWDIEAGDFASMLSKAFSQADRLVESRYRYPCRMLKRFAELYPEDVRSLFRVLYDESRPMALRIRAYLLGMDMLLERVESGSAAAHFQTYHVVSVALWLRYPDNHFIYKHKVAQSLFDALGVKQMPRGVGAIVATYELYGVVAEVLRSDAAYRSMLDAALDEGCYPDRAMVTAAIDFAEYVARYRVRYQPAGQGAGLYPTWDDAIVRVLGDSKEAMRSAEVAERIVRDGLYSTARRSPQRIVACYIKENALGLYRLVRRGCYTLSEFGRARYRVLVGSVDYPIFETRLAVAAEVESNYAAYTLNIEEEYNLVFDDTSTDNKAFERFVNRYFSSQYPTLYVGCEHGVLLCSKGVEVVVLPYTYVESASHYQVMAELYERVNRGGCSVGLLLYVGGDAPVFNAVIDGKRLMVASVGANASFYEFCQAVDRAIERIFV